MSNEEQAITEQKEDSQARLANDKDVYYTEEDVRNHNRIDDCWIIIHGKVYDVSAFQNDHPGGADPMRSFAGKDASCAYDDIGHSFMAKSLLVKYQIGRIAKHKTDFKENKSEFDVNLSGLRVRNLTPLLILLIMIVLTIISAYVLRSYTQGSIQ